MAHLITYDLRKPGRNYQPLHDAIKALGDWVHPLESVWIVDSWQKAATIAEHLRRFIDSNDSLLVIGLTGDYGGWLHEEAWQWLRSHRLAA